MSDDYVLYDENHENAPRNQKLEGLEIATGVVDAVMDTDLSGVSRIFYYFYEDKTI